MIRKYVLPLLALAGLVAAIFTVQAGSRPTPAAAPVVTPPLAPFKSYVAGAGIVESSTRNVAIGTPIPGLVMEVYVEAGDQVKTGQPLFKLDDRALVAEHAARQAALEAAHAQLAKLLAQPRPEDLPPAEARAKVAEFSLADVQSELALWETLTDKRAVSQEEMDRRRFAVRVAEARLAEARAQLELLKAGAWKPDVEIARAQAASAAAQVQQAQTEIDRLLIKAPLDGQVLQRNVQPGEYASGGNGSEPLMLLGNVRQLHVRVDVDENDAWRVRRGTPAIAYLRGNPQFKADLQFVRFEPFVVPKRSLTGASTERVDTRVLQIIYRFSGDDLPVYVGQLMDVFIDAAPVGDAPTTAVDEPGAGGAKGNSP